MGHLPFEESRLHIQTGQLKVVRELKEPFSGRRSRES